MFPCENFQVSQHHLKVFWQHYVSCLRSVFDRDVWRWQKPCLSRLDKSIRQIDGSASKASGRIPALIKALSSSSDRLHHRCPPALPGSVSVRLRSRGLWPLRLLLMFSCHRLAFHRTVSQWPAASHQERHREREISTQMLPGLIWCL